MLKQKSGKCRKYFTELINMLWEPTNVFIMKLLNASECKMHWN